MVPPALLCVDDRPELCELRKSILEPLGYLIVTASSAPEAIAMLESTSVAAVLLEYKSEGMDAEAAAYLVKHHFPQQPIILLSAYSDIPERVLRFVDECVMRTDLPERLAQAIDRVMRRSGAIELPDRRRAAA